MVELLQDSNVKSHFKVFRFHNSVKNLVHLAKVLFPFFRMRYNRHQMPTTLYGLIILISNICGIIVLQVTTSVQ